MLWLLSCMEETQALCARYEIILAPLVEVPLNVLLHQQKNGSGVKKSCPCA
jgi:hypothetical protein